MQRVRLGAAMLALSVCGSVLPGTAFGLDMGAGTRSVPAEEDVCVLTERSEGLDRSCGAPEAADVETLTEPPWPDLPGVGTTPKPTGVSYRSAGPADGPSIRSLWQIRALAEFLVGTIR